MSMNGFHGVEREMRHRDRGYREVILKMRRGGFKVALEGWTEIRVKGEVSCGQS